MQIKTTLFILIILSSCSKDPDVLPPIASKIKPHVESFLREAKQRNVNISLYEWSFVLTNDSLGEAGLCVHSTKTIYIDTTSQNYRFNPEHLIFHEIGHAVLGRGHRTGSFNNQYNDIISLMDCCGIANYLNENSFKRDYYINELFNESTPAPYWCH